MSYVRSRLTQSLDHGVVQGFAKLLSLDIPPEDLDAVSTSLAEQVASLTSLDRLDLTNIVPILKMDPRWYE
jgi:hypothetical protein